MAVLLAKPPCVMETVNDLHAGLVNLARVIQDDVLGPAFYRRLRRVLMHETFFQESDAEFRADESRDFAGRILRDEDAATASNRLLCAYDYFIVSWLGRNGSSGTPAASKGTYCVRYTGNGGHAGKRWNSAVASIPAWRRRMRNVTILNRDGFDLLARIEDAEGTAIYCDPPYLVKGDKYLHDFEAQDHQRLADSLGRFRKARVVVSYYEHPLLDKLYPSWTRVCRTVNKALAHGGQRGANQSQAVEVLLLNGPSYTQPTMPLMEGAAR